MERQKCASSITFFVFNFPFFSTISFCALVRFRFEFVLSSEKKKKKKKKNAILSICSKLRVLFSDLRGKRNALFCCVFRKRSKMRRRFCKFARVNFVVDFKFACRVSSRSSRRKGVLGVHEVAGGLRKFGLREEEGLTLFFSFL